MMTMINYVAKKKKTLNRTGDSKLHVGNGIGRDDCGAKRFQDSGVSAPSARSRNLGECRRSKW